MLQQAQPYVAAPAALPAATGQWTHENTVQLYHLRYEQVVANGLSALVVQRVFQIRNRSGAEWFAPDNLWYDSARGHFQLVRAEVWRRARAGAPYTLAGEGTDEGDLPGFALGTQPRRIGLPPLRAGDRVSLLYVVLPDTGAAWSVLGGHFIGNMFAFRDSFGTRQVRYVLAAREPMAVSGRGLAAPVHRRLADGFQTWAWTARDQPAFFQSSGGPAITEVSPFVQVSGFFSWTSMADWYAELLGQRAQLSPRLETQLRELAGPVPTTWTVAQARQTVARVWAYLSAHLSYLGNENGVHAYVPSPVGEVFRREAGDCKDGALLLATWLRAVGIEAHLALVRTPAMGPLAPGGAGGDAAATMAAFDHALVYVPLTGQWIDTTAPHRLDTELPAGDQDSVALIVRSGQPGLVRVPEAVASANLTRSTMQLTPAGAGWYSADGQLEVRGEQAPAMRTLYAPAAKRQTRVQAWLRQQWPGAEVETVSVAGVEPAQPTVAIRYRARIPKLPATTARVSQALTALLTPEEARDEPLVLPMRWEQDQTWTLRLPEGVACPRMVGGAPRAPGWQRTSRFGDASEQVHCGEGRLQVRVRVRQTGRQVPPGQYPAFRHFWNGVATALQQPVTLPAAPSPQAVTVAAREP